MDIIKDLGKDKFRTFLSLLGVSVGIFSIVIVLSLVNTLKEGIRKSIEQLGKDLVLIQTIPLDISEEYNNSSWWKYLKREQISYFDFNFIRKEIKTASALSYLTTNETSINKGIRVFESAIVCGVDGDWESIIGGEISKGRSFSKQDLNSRDQIAIIGNNVLEELFSEQDAVIGNTIQIAQKDINVIGYFSKEGNNILSLYDLDNIVILPINCYKSIFSEKESVSQIAGKPLKDINQETFIIELRSLLRSTRRLTPNQEDDFSINTLSFLTKQTEPILKSIDKIGFLIGLFSLLIGAFGIVNIMFVSVKERTQIIGIQKALGASKKRILLNFLAESAILSFLGGIVGVALAFIVVFLLPPEIAAIKIGVIQVVSGLTISLLVGILAGFFPARYASMLHPIEAINDFSV